MIRVIYLIEDTETKEKYEISANIDGDLVRKPLFLMGFVRRMYDQIIVMSHDISVEINH